MHDHDPDCAVCAARAARITDAPPTPEEIEALRVIAVTAELHGYTVDDLLGYRRTRGLVWARHVAMYLCRARTPLSLPALGRVFGRHHTSVMHGVGRIADGWIAEDAGTRAAVSRVTEALDG